MKHLPSPRTVEPVAPSERDLISRLNRAQRQATRFKSAGRLRDFARVQGQIQRLRHLLGQTA